MPDELDQNQLDMVASTTKFTDLPDEVVEIIMVRLSNDIRSIINFASTCHRYLGLLQRLTRRPVGLHYMYIDYKLPEYCGCTIGHFAQKSSIHSLFDSVIFRKWIRFRGLTMHIKFPRSDDQILRCLDTIFNDALRFNNLAQTNIEQLVELNITVNSHRFLLKIINYLPNVKYLTVICRGPSRNRTPDVAVYTEFSGNIERLTLYPYYIEHRPYFGRNLIDYFRPRIVSFVYATIALNGCLERMSVNGDTIRYSINDFLYDKYDSGLYLDTSLYRTQFSPVEGIHRKTNYIPTKFKNIEIIPWAYHDIHKSTYGKFSFCYTITNLPSEQQELDKILGAIPNMCDKEYRNLRKQWRQCPKLGMIYPGRSVEVVSHPPINHDARHQAPILLRNFQRER